MSYQPPPPGYPQPPPPGYSHPGYHHQPGYPPPPPQQQQQSVVVVNAGQPTTNTVVVHRQGVNHVLHFIITLLFWPWIIVWIILCIMDN